MSQGLLLNGLSGCPILLGQCQATLNPANEPDASVSISNLPFYSHERHGGENIQMNDPHKRRNFGCDTALTTGKGKF